MSAGEVKEIDGGGWVKFVLGLLAGVGVTADLDALADAFREGYDSQRK